MGLEQARKDIERAVRAFFGPALHGTWHIKPGELSSARNVVIRVNHEAGKKATKELERLKKILVGIVCCYGCGECTDVQVDQDWNSGKTVWLSFAEKRCDVKRQIETAVPRVIRNVESMTWGANPADPEHIKVLKIKHGFAHWTNGETEALAECIKGALRENTRLKIWGIRRGQTETEVHIFNPKPASTPEDYGAHPFLIKQLNVDEPRLIIRDELGDWIREQQKKKTEERKMFAVNEIVAITEGTKVIQLVVHKEETQKEMTMTAQVAAQHQNDTVRKVDVAGDVLVLHVGCVKD